MIKECILNEDENWKIGSIITCTDNEKYVIVDDQPLSILVSATRSIIWLEVEPLSTVTEQRKKELAELNRLKQEDYKTLNDEGWWY